MRGTHSPATTSGESPGHIRQSLASGFRNVDSSGDAAAYRRCLDLIAGIPFFRDVKEESYRIIADTSPQTVLDAGCGEEPISSPWLPVFLQTVRYSG